MRIKQIRYLLFLKEFIADSIGLVIGTAIMAFGVSQFLLPNQLSSGGFSGIATILYYIFQMPMGLMVVLLNVPLFLFSFFKMGKDYFIKAAIGTGLLSTFIDTFDKFPALTNDRFLACIYGGIIIGLGTAIVLKVRGSTGGTDLLSYVIRSYKPSFKTSNLLVIFDMMIVVLNVLVFKQIEIGLYSAITIYIMGKIIDVVFEGIYFTKIMLIISDKHKEIAEKIANMLGRGSTGIYAKGMYTNEEKMMLMCIANRTEVYKIKAIARKADEKAFIVITNAREVVGKGFKKKID